LLDYFSDFQCTACIIHSAVIELYDGPSAAPATVPEIASSPLDVPVSSLPLALGADQPPAALMWEGYQEPPELELSEDESSVSSEVGPELPAPVALPRRMTLPWRQLLPRLFCKAACSYLI